MTSYKNEAIIDYPVEDIFKLFKKIAKRDFPKFNEKNPIGCKVERQVGSYSVKEGKMLVEITGYEEYKLYEITSRYNRTTYISRYEFYPINSESTRLVLTEKQSAYGMMSFLNDIIAGIFFKGRVRKRFKFFNKFLIEELQKNTVST